MVHGHARRALVLLLLTGCSPDAAAITDAAPVPGCTTRAAPTGRAAGSNELQPGAQRLRAATSPDGISWTRLPATVTDQAAVVPADFNGDGVLDLLVTGIVTEPHLWVSEGCTTGAWLDVRLIGTADNLHGLGARVEVEAGGTTFTSWATSSASLFAGRAPWVQVGLGNVEQVDRLTIT